MCVCVCVFARVLVRECLCARARECARVSVCARVRVTVCESVIE